MRLYGRKAAGFKLFHRFHGYSLLDPELDPFYKKVAELEKTLVISLHLFDERFANQYLRFLPPVDTADLLRLAQKHPAVNFVFSAPLVAEAAELLTSGGRNVFVTNSFLEGVGMERLSTRYASRILSGSNFPFFLLEASGARLKIPGLPQKKRVEIGRRNAARLFDIS